MLPVWIPKYNLSKKELVYLILPLFLLLILFPTILYSNQVFIVGSNTDALTLITSELSVIKTPLSLWNNQWLTGLPEYANPLSDRFYPLFYPFFVLTQDPFIISFVILFHLYIAYLCFYKLAGLMTKIPELRMVGGLFFIFSGVLLSRVFIGHLLILFAIAWLPLLYYAFFKIVWDNEVTVKNIGIISLSLGLIFFTGALYYLFYSCLILFVFFLYYIITNSISKGAILAVIGSFTISALIVAIKAVPVVLVSGALVRIDLINPIGDGGSLESSLASIIFGTPIDKIFGFWESSILIGMIPLAFVILALVYDREKRAIPAFFAMVAVFIWADGGQTILSFIHLLPVTSNFRVAGRVFGALLPLLLLFMVCGIELLIKHIKDIDSFIPTDKQKRNILWGMGVLAAVKLCELPFQQIPSLQSGLSVAFVLIFIGLIYYTTLNKVMLFVIPVYIINYFVLFAFNTAGSLVANQTNALLCLAITLIVFATIAIFNHGWFKTPFDRQVYIYILLVLGLFMVLLSGASYLHTSDPKLNDSPAVVIADNFTTANTDGHQIWVYETGWSYQHLDFTYWFIKNGIHPMRAYYGYFPKTSVSPTYNIGNITYYAPDYVVDTQSLENGNQNLPEVTFKVNNISVYKPEHVLPNAFVIRNEQLIPVTLDKFTSDEVIISGQFQQGDIAVLKTAFFPGWKMNGKETENTVNMVGSQITTNTNTVTFRYDPFDVKVAGLISGIGILILGIMVYKRREINTYLKNVSTVPELPVKKSKKKR